MIVNGAAKEIGRAAVLAVTKARGMEVAGAVDSHFVGEDIGKVFLLSLIKSIFMFQSDIIKQIRNSPNGFLFASNSLC